MISSFCLNDLPVEIIRQIAIYCPLRSLLDLSIVNRPLREACYDAIVLQNVARLHGLSSEAEKLIQQICDSQPALRVQTWARYIEALRISSRYDLTKPDVWQRREKPFDFESYLPQLMITCGAVRGDNDPSFFLKYPLRSYHYLSMSNEQKYLRPDTDDRIAFCFAVTMLNLPPVRDVVDRMVPVIDSIIDLRLTRMTTIHDTNHAKLFVIVGMFAFAFSLNVTGDTTFGPAHYPTYMEMPRSISKDALVQLPLPFDINGAKRFNDWLLAHTADLLDPTFLEQGTWRGAYTYGYTLNHIDPPMRDVHFVVSPKNDEHSSQQRSESGTMSGYCSDGALDVKATGVDSIGNFKLSGTLRRSGKAHLVKEYIGGHSWAWTCMMTPFGFVGYWGDAGYGGTCGLLWLWKGEWTEA